MNDKNTQLVLKALYAATSAIVESEDSGRGHCRWCGSEEYPVDRNGEPTGDPAQYNEFRIDHNSDCPSYIIDHAFDGIDIEVVMEVLKAANA